MNTLECTNERELTDAELESVTGGLHQHYRLYIEGDEDLSVPATPIIAVTLPVTTGTTPVTTPVTVG